MSNSLILERHAAVTTADADCYGRLRPGAMVNYMLQAAVASADEMGFGLAFLRKNKLYWVLSRFNLRISA